MSDALPVVMPYRDVAETVEEAVDSVLASRGAPVRVIAVDDGSRDGSADVVARLAARHRDVERASSGGVGIVGALRVGLAACAGAPLVARMDADDVAHADRFAASLALLARQPELALVGTGADVLSDGVVTPGLARYVAWQNALVTPEDHARAMFVESPVCHPTWTLRRAALDAIGGYRDVPWPEDWDVLLRLHAAGHAIAKVPDVLLSWRHRAGRLTFTDPRYDRARFDDARAAFLVPRLAAERRDVIVWGAGPTGRHLARALLRAGGRVAAFVDIDPRKLGHHRYGAPVVPPDTLDRARHFVLAAVGARGARDEIRAHLASLGFVETTDFVCCA